MIRLIINIGYVKPFVCIPGRGQGMILKDLVCLLHSDLLHGGLPLQDGGHGHQTTKLWLVEEILEGTYVVTYVGILLVSRNDF